MCSIEMLFGHSDSQAPVLVQLPNPSSSILATIAFARRAASIFPCGGHFRLESVTEEGEAKRDDEHYQYVSVWEYKGDNKEPELHKEALVFENIQVAQRSYK